VRSANRVGEPDGREREREPSGAVTADSWTDLSRATASASDRVRNHKCRRLLSAQSITLAAPVNGKIGARVIADILHLGRVEGNVARVFDRGFAMSVRASNEERTRLVGRIEWLAKHKDEQEPDQRANARFSPMNPYSRLILADGTVMICFVVDLSESGAAISARLFRTSGRSLRSAKLSLAWYAILTEDFR
jgi:hypothetical protein